jgi:cytochrome P450
MTLTLDGPTDAAPSFSAQPVDLRDPGWLTRPRDMVRLRQEPKLLPIAVEETLRYESPTHVLARFTVEPRRVGDVQVPAGEVLYCMVGAANHDPVVFDQPERFDIARDPNPQLAFGGGAHCCVGAALRRLEGELAFAVLLPRWSALQLVRQAGERPRWRPTINLRGLQSLWVRPC